MEEKEQDPGGLGLKRQQTGSLPLAKKTSLKSVRKRKLVERKRGLETRSERRH